MTVGLAYDTPGTNTASIYSCEQAHANRSKHKSSAGLSLHDGEDAPEEGTSKEGLHEEFDLQHSTAARGKTGVSESELGESRHDSLREMGQQYQGDWSRDPKRRSASSSCSERVAARRP